MRGMPGLVSRFDIDEYRLKDFIIISPMLMCEIYSFVS